MRSPATLRLEPEISWRAVGRAAPPFDRRLAPLLAAIRARRYAACCGAGGGALVSRGVGPPERHRAGPGRAAGRASARAWHAAQRRRGAARRRGCPGGPPAARVRARDRYRPAARAARLAPGGSRSSRATISCSPHCAITGRGPKGIVGELAFKGSLESLGALARGEADIAGFHAGTPPGSDAMAPLRRLLDPRRDVLVRFAEREQGLMVRRGNPKRLRSLGDVAAKDARFVNRQRGSGHAPADRSAAERREHRPKGDPGLRDRGVHPPRGGSDRRRRPCRRGLRPESGRAPLRSRLHPGAT